MSEPAAYRSAGVDYSVLDAAKRLALKAAAGTADNPLRRGARIDPAFFGEPAAVLDLGGVRLGFVLECLGTKSLVARDYEEATGEDHYRAVGYDTVAAAVNDCVCVGALPVVVSAYFATGAAAFYDGSRAASLVAGFSEGCAAAGAAWGGGESPTLTGLVDPGGIDLAASCVGLVPMGLEPLSGAALRPGDEIVLVASSGLHQNGASLARSLASGLPDGLLTELSDGERLGAALLRPGHIYVGLVEAVRAAGLPLHYASHITGHGLRKLMRADRVLTYRIDALPDVPPVLAFLVEAAGMSPEEAYATFNMGAGFALYVGGGSGEEVAALSAGLGLRAVVAGEVREGGRAVVLGPLGITYGEETLALR